MGGEMIWRVESRIGRLMRVRACSSVAAAAVLWAATSADLRHAVKGGLPSGEVQIVTPEGRILARLALLACLALALVGCGGDAFSAAQLDALHVEGGAPDAMVAEDAGIDAGGILADALSDTFTPTPEAGKLDGEAGLTALQGCVAYYNARSKSCPCVAVYHGCDEQVTDAGDCRASLGACETSCHYDGGAGSDALCYCLFSCLAAGPCLVPDQGYLVCDVSDCNAANCP